MGTLTAITGKGGTGKTTISALLIRYLLNMQQRPILAVDADPDANLSFALGVDSEKSLATVGGTRQDFFDNKGAVPAGMPKEAYLDLMLNQALIETSDFDLLVMGRPEGAGCYCYINNVLRKYLEMLTGNYPHIVIDNEAGLEHLSRRTAHTIDHLVIVSDYSLNGLRAAHRIRDLAEEMKLRVARCSLVINNAPAKLNPSFAEAIAQTGLKLLGCVPSDPAIPDCDIAGRTILSLDEGHPAVTAFDAFAPDLIV